MVGVVIRNEVSYLLFFTVLFQSIHHRRLDKYGMFRFIIKFLWQLRETNTCPGISRVDCGLLAKDSKQC